MTRRAPRPFGEKLWDELREFLDELAEIDPDEYVYMHPGEDSPLEAALVKAKGLRRTMVEEQTRRAT